MEPPHAIERNGNGLLSNGNLINGGLSNDILTNDNLGNGNLSKGNLSNGDAGNGGPGYPTPSSASHTLSQPSHSPELSSISCEENGRIYSLEVFQQPIRARMCGFGDKDRRPITPPPCVKLIVKDAITKEDVDMSEADLAYYVLSVNLWSGDGKREVNLVRHSATSPSISAATASSYPPAPPTPPPYQTNGSSAPNSAHPLNMQQPQWHQQQYLPQQSPTQPALPAQYGYPNGGTNVFSTYRQPQPLPPPPPSHYPQVQPQYHPSQQYPPQHQQQVYYSAPTTNGLTYFTQPSPQGPLLPPEQLQPQAGQTTSGMFTRNLIGSLVVSAFKLNNVEGKSGIWFVLQDLSVRTEGSFRLKMNFVSCGIPGTTPTLNTASAPILASTFSDEFQVFSAKKFPGVIESTPLSKCFAQQGIKIPIRKDGPRGNIRDHDEYEEDNV